MDCGRDEGLHESLLGDQVELEGLNVDQRLVDRDAVGVSYPVENIIKEHLNGRVKNQNGSARCEREQKKVDEPPWPAADSR